MGAAPNTFYLIDWPETRAVPESEARDWAMDAIDNAEIDGPADADTETLLRQLDQAGKITWSGGSRLVMEMAEIEAAYPEEDEGTNEEPPGWLYDTEGRQREAGPTLDQAAGVKRAQFLEHYGIPSEWDAEAFHAQHDDDPNPYHGDYSEE